MPFPKIIVTPMPDIFDVTGAYIVLYGTSLYILL